MTPGRALVARFDALARRERVLVFAALVTLLGGVALTMFIDPSLKRAKAARDAMADRQNQLTVLRSQHAEHTARLAQDINAPLHAELAKVQVELAAVESEVRALHHSLIPAQDMGQVLGGLLQKKAGARLVSLRNLPPEPVLTQATAPRVAPNGSPPRALLFRHGVELVIEGGYFDLLDYLVTLEQQPWRVPWTETSLTARYPVARLRLKIHTLSLDESWLSV